MDLHKTSEKLINESKEILREYDLIRERNGVDSNIFTVLGMERDEVNTHSNMLYSICKSYSTKRPRDNFIKMLLTELNLPEAFQNETWDVEREYFTKSGRIDLFFKSTTQDKKNYRCIVIELKIDACDQERQLKRYEEYAKSYFDDYRILYLTLDGKEPVEQSFKNIAEGKFKCISFKAHILPWLVQCIEENSGKVFDSSFIMQYEILLKKLVGENNMQNDIKNLIYTSHELLAGMEIAKSVQDVKNEITNNFMKAVKQKFLSQGYVVLTEHSVDKSNSNIEVCKCLEYEIKEFKFGDKSLYFSIGIEIETNLYYYIGFYEKIDGELNFADSNEICTSYKSIYDACEKSVIQALGVEIRKNGYYSMYYENIRDKDGRIYDFKHFSNNCAGLMETSKKEAERIAPEIIDSLERIRNLLNDNWTQ